MCCVLVCQKFPESCCETVPILVSLTMVLSRPCRAFRLSTPLSSGWSMVWRPWHCARWYCLKLLNTPDFPRRKPFVMACALAYLLGYSPWLQYRRNSTSTRVFKMWDPNFVTVSHVFHFTVHFLQPSHWTREENDMHALTVTSRRSPADSTLDCFQFNCQAGH